MEIDHNTIKCWINEADICINLTKETANFSSKYYNKKFYWDYPVFYWQDYLHLRDSSWYPKDALNFPKAPFFVLAFSRIHPSKNIEILMDAYYEASKEMENSWMIIGGLVQDESYLAYLKGLASKMLGANFIFIESPTDNTMAELYREATVFMCADPADFNISTYTALATPMPVLVPPTYDFEKVILNTGFIHFCTKSSEYKDILVRLYTGIRDNPLFIISELGFDTIQDALAEHTIEKYAERIMTLANGH